MENPRDLSQFDNPQLTLENLHGLIVKQKYLLLGSASGNLLKQSSESLAGRIGYYYMGGLSLHDVGSNSLNKLWLRGGLPKSFTAKNEHDSFNWLSNYISTFLERDIPQLGISIPANTLRRFWIMVKKLPQSR